MWGRPRELPPAAAPRGGLGMLDASGLRRFHFSVPAGRPGVGGCFWHHVAMEEAGDCGGRLRLRASHPGEEIPGSLRAAPGCPADYRHGHAVRSCRSKKTSLRCSQQPWQARESRGRAREPSCALWTPEARQMRLSEARGSLSGRFRWWRHVFLCVWFYFYSLPAKRPRVGKKNPEKKEGGKNEKNVKKEE